MSRVTKIAAPLIALVMGVVPMVAYAQIVVSPQVTTPREVTVIPGGRSTNMSVTPRYLAAQRLHRNLEEIRRDGIAWRREDGGSLSEAHRALLQARLNRALTQWAPYRNPLS